MARCILPLSESATMQLKGALEGNVLPLTACAEVELVGVAPRLPLTATFDPAALLGALAALLDDQRRIARAALLEVMAERGGSWLFGLVGSLADADVPLFAEALTDWVRARFGSFVAAPGSDMTPHLALVGQSASGTVALDLAQPLQAGRGFVLELDPIEAARALVRQQGIDTVFRATVVPSLQTGYPPVSVAANLPTRRRVLSIRAHPSAAPHPPLPL